MKKLLSVLIILFLWTGLFSQLKELVFNSAIIYELVNGQSKKSEVVKHIACTIDSKNIQVSNLWEIDSVLLFQIVEIDGIYGGTKVYTCTHDGKEYNITINRDSSEMIINGTNETILLQKNKAEAVESQTQDVKIIKKNCP